MDEPGPCVRSALTFAVEPFEEDSFGPIDVAGTLLRVVCDGVVVKVSDNFDPGLPEHLAFAQYTTSFLCPVHEVPQTLPQFLATRSALDLEVSALGRSAVVRKSKKGKLLRFSASLPRSFSGITSKLDTASLLLIKIQHKLVDKSC